MTKIRNNDYLKALGKRIRDLRIEKKISVYEFSYESNISRSQINSIEKGDLNTTICTIKVIAETLEIKIKDLLDF